MTKIELNPDADYSDMESLAIEVLDRIAEFTKEQKNFDENDFDGMYDYIGGLISAYQSVAGMIGVPLELTYPEEN
jgi:hypothetical protein